MPYTIRFNKQSSRPWQIVRKDTGKVVGTSLTRKNAIGSIINREKGEPDENRKAIKIRNSRRA